MSQAEISARWARANPEKMRAASARWREKNPGKAAASLVRLRAKKRAFLQRWKLAAGCIDCGYAEHAVALDFDHVQGEKSFGLGQALSQSWTAMFAEIEKCVVRCSNCHRVATHRRRS